MANVSSRSNGSRNPLSMRAEAQSEGLTLRELRFVEAYLGVADGNAAEAYRLAGYLVGGGTIMAAPSMLLSRPRIQEALKRITERRLAVGGGMDKDAIRRSVETIVKSGKPQDVIRAAEFLARVEGWFAPTKSVRENLHLALGTGPNTYAALVETLRAHGKSLSGEQRGVIRDRLVADRGLIDDALGLLDIRQLAAGVQ